MYLVARSTRTILGIWENEMLGSERGVASCRRLARGGPVTVEVIGAGPHPQI